MLPRECRGCAAGFRDAKGYPTLVKIHIQMYVTQFNDEKVTPSSLLALIAE
jgi:hypothetical protein